MQLTEHFSLEEMCKSQTAERHGIDNIPRDPAIVEALRAVCANILEPARTFYGIPIIPNSGYRSPAVNELVGGSPRSQHMVGEAVDFEVGTATNFQLALWIADHLDYDQLILEFYKPGQPTSGWVHCSYVAGRPNRRDRRTTSDGRTFLPGLVA